MAAGPELTRCEIAAIVPALGILIGFSVAYAANLQVRRGARFWRDAYLPGMLLYELLVLLPPALYLFIKYPHWSSLFLVPPGTASRAWPVLLVMAGTLLLSFLGFAAGFALCRARRQGLVLGCLLLMAGGLVAIVAAVQSRLRGLAGSAAWDGPSSSNLVLFLALVVPVVLGGWIFLLVLFIMEGRKVDRARIGTIHPDALAAAGEKSTSAYPARLSSAEKLVSLDDSESSPPPPERSPAGDSAD